MICRLYKYFLFAPILFLSLSIKGQTIGNCIGKYIGVSASDMVKEAQVSLKQGVINNAIGDYSLAIYQAQNQRNSGQGVSGDLLAEYSYALALHHDFEAALMNIDRARMVGTKYGDFYAAQVLTLMGYSNAAQQLMKQAKIPDWLSDTYQGLNAKYKTTVSINRDVPETALKRANRLAASRQTIQAMALFEELAAIYPDTYIHYCPVNVDEELFEIIEIQSTTALFKGATI